MYAIVGYANTDTEYNKYVYLPDAIIYSTEKYFTLALFIKNNDGVYVNISHENKTITNNPFNPSDYNDKSIYLFIGNST